MNRTSGPMALLTALLVVLAVALLGCPRPPEVTLSPSGAAGPETQQAPRGPETRPAPREPEVSSRASEAPVPVLPMAPRESPLTTAPESAPTTSQQATGASPLKDIFFEFDAAELREDQKAVLNENVAWLRDNVRVRILVEGHCDERGAAEYNLGLGQQRAKVVKDYLVAAGIAPDRVNTVSYGKEHPFVRGHDETAWKWNRRARLVVTRQ